MAASVCMSDTLPTIQRECQLKLNRLLERGTLRRSALFTFWVVAGSTGIGRMSDGLTIWSGG